MRTARVAIVSGDSGIRSELVSRIQAAGAVLIYVEPTPASLIRLREESITCVLASSEHLFTVTAVLKNFAPIISFAIEDDVEEIYSMVSAAAGLSGPRRLASSD